MSVKPIIANPKELSSTSQKEFDNKFFKLVKKLAKKHTNQDTAAPFFLDLNAQYSDGEGLLVIFGKMNAWKKHAKETATKSEAVRGYCFVSTDAQSKVLVLHLMPVAGKLKSKEKLIRKSIKSVVSAGKMVVELVKGEFEDNEALDSAVEAMEESADETENETEGKPAVDGNNPTTNPTDKSETDKEQAKRDADFKFSVNETMPQLTALGKSGILNKAKNKEKLTAEETDFAQETLSIFDFFIGAYGYASPALQEKTKQVLKAVKMYSKVLLQLDNMTEFAGGIGIAQETINENKAAFQKFKTEILPKYKAKQLSKDDLETLFAIQRDFNNFQNLYKEMDDTDKADTLHTQLHTSITAAYPILQKIITELEGKTSANPKLSPKQNEVFDRMKAINDRINAIEKELQGSTSSK